MTAHAPFTSETVYIPEGCDITRLTQEEVDKIQEMHDNAMKIIENMGMIFHEPELLEICKENGIRVEGDKAFFTEEQIMYWIDKIPNKFTLYAPNPKWDCIVGGDEVNLTPGYGCPSITEPDGKRRDADIDDFIEFIKLFEANDDFKMNGGPVVHPMDVPTRTACLSMFYAQLTHSEKALLVDAGDRQCAKAMVDAAAAMFGGYEAIKEKPRLITLVNVNSPMAMGAGPMSDTLIEFAKAGQPFAVADLAMAGTSAPMTLAGTMSMAIAETFPIMAVAQMINPGTPVIMGTQNTVADMASAQIAAGAPEGALCYLWLAKIAKFYGIPCRGGGALTDSKIVDAQSGYESMITLNSNFLGRTNFVIHAAGILDGFGSTSFEKVLQDFEITAYLKRYYDEGIEVDEERLAYDTVMEVGHMGSYLLTDHTLDFCREEAISPQIASRGTVHDPVNQYQNRLDAYRQKLLSMYKKPEVPAAELKAVQDIFAEAGLDRAWLEEVAAK